ncbi:MAG TPA: hypothetical protein DC005_06180, partial [Proteobacteria bacterium]|nr:hypothetical protein [Pseudomonadota bacterium]
ARTLATRHLPHSRGEAAGHTDRGGQHDRRRPVRWSIVSAHFQPSGASRLGAGHAAAGGGESHPDSSTDRIEPAG